MPTSASSSNIRPPAVAGKFYPESAEELSHEIDVYLNEAIIETPAGEIISLIVPHAGYVFSGWIAAHGYKAIIGKHFDTVILVGLCHQGLDGVAIYDKGGFETPLGVVRIDSEMAKQMMEMAPNLIFSQPLAHSMEHSLEVQIPFLQKTLQNFRIVPILIDETLLSRSLAEVILETVRKNNDKKILLIGSSDLTHYPTYEEAVEVDQDSIQAILSMKSEQIDRVNREWLRKGIPNLHCTMCSEAAVKTVLAASTKLGADKATLLKSANSGDVAIGSQHQVVGYAAIAITKSNKSSKKQKEPVKQEPSTDDIKLSQEAKKELLRIARKSLISCVMKTDDSEISSSFPELEQPLGAFVTLKRNDDLRGCIGRFEPNGPVKEVVSNMAQAAALEDPRFNPVQQEELKDIKIEISVLSPRREIFDIKEIKIGKHGLYITRDFYSGTLLPQVASEYKWDVETFLMHTCMKAGLPSNAWKDPETRIYVYSAVIFHEL